jgi:hypothetical protein
VDNTLKILLGVLSVTGFITVVIPQGDPVAPGQAADVAQPEVTAPSPEPAAPPPSPPPVPFDSGASVEFITGAPSIDGRPIQADFGLPFGVSPRSERENPDAPRKNKIGYTPPVFSNPRAPTQKQEEEMEENMETNAPLRSEPRNQGLLGSPATIDR